MNTTLLKAALFVLLNALSISLYSQSPNTLDSLKKVLSTSEIDTSKVKTLFEIAAYYENRARDSSIVYYQKGIDLTQELTKNTSGVKTLKALKILYADGLNEIGSVYIKDKDYETGKESLLKSYKIKTELGSPPLSYTSFYFDMSLYHYYQRNYDSSIYYNRMKLKIFLEFNDTLSIAKTYSDLVIAYRKNKDYSNSILSSKRSIRYYTKLNNLNKVADQYFSSAMTYYAKSELDSAAISFKQSSDAYVKANNLPDAIDQNGNVAYVYALQGQMEKATDIYLDNLSKAKQLNSKEEIAGALISLGNMERRQNNNDDAISYYKKSLKHYLELEDLDQVSMCYNNIGLAYNSKNNFLLAEEYYIKSLKILEKVEGVVDKSYANENLATLYFYQGQIQKSIDLFLEVIKDREARQAPSDLAASYNNIAAVFRAHGNALKFEEYAQKSLAINQKLGKLSGLATDFGNLGQHYIAQGDYEKGIEFTKKSIVIGKKIHDMNGVTTRIMNLGMAYSYMNEYDTAFYYLDQALLISKDLDDKMNYVKALNNVGSVYEIFDKYDKALKYYKTSLNIARKINLKSNKIYALKSIGGVFLKKKELDSARYYLDKSVLLYKGIHEPDLEKKIFSKSVNLEILDQNLMQSDLLYIHLMKTIRSQIENNFSSLSERSQGLYFNTIEEDFMGFYSYALFRKKENKKIVGNVYNNALKNKGILLKSSTAMRLAILNSGDSILAQNYFEWIQLQKDISKLMAKGENVKELKDKANLLEKNLVKSSQDFSEITKLQSISWKDIKNELKQGEAAIEIIHFKYKDYPNSALFTFSDTIIYCALIVKYDSEYPLMIPLFNENDLDTILGKIGRNDFKYINTVYGDKSNTNTKLYELIWKPMEKELKGVTKIYFAPDGLLHKISIPAIAKEVDVYLTDLYDIDIKSSTGKLIQQDNKESFSINSATLFGGIDYNTDSTSFKAWSYLSGTKTEILEINEILLSKKINVNYFSNSTATEEEFKFAASNSTILHIATHGFFYPDPKKLREETKKEEEVGEITFRGGRKGLGVSSFVENTNPLMRSGLVFAGANDVWSMETQEGEDGVLTAQEVAHLDMRKTNLVVLSACETGLGDIIGGEGVYGLQRSFKMAGVHYIIMSLWQVPDKETEEFMTLFYKKLLKLKDIKQAFSDTQKAMRKKYDPYFWAAFVLVE